MMNNEIPDTVIYVNVVERDGGVDRYEGVKCDEPGWWPTDR